MTEAKATVLLGEAKVDNPWAVSLDYPMPARYLQAGDVGITTRRGDLLAQLTQNLLDGQIDLPDYRKQFAESRADLNAHAEALVRILQDGRFPALFILDLLDTYPDGTLLYRFAIENKRPLVQSALAATVASLPGDTEGMSEQYRVSLKFGFPAQETKTYASLQDATSDYVQGNLTWQQYAPLFVQSTEDYQAHKRAFDSLLGDMTRTVAEKYPRLAELLRDYAKGDVLLNQYYARWPATGTSVRELLDAALRALNDPAVNERFHLSGRTVVRTGSAPRVA